MNSVIRTGSDAICDVIETVCLNPITLPVALGMVIQWYLGVCLKSKHRWFRHLRNENVRMFGIDLIILQIFYASYLIPITEGHQFVISFMILVGESILSIVFRSKFISEKLPELNTLQVENRYQDISVLFHKMLLYFWVQCALFAYFVYFVNNSTTVHLRKDASLLKWCIAASLTMIAGTDEAGTRFKYRYWARLLQLAPPENAKDKIFNLFNISFELHWKMRRFCDFFINGIARVTILGIAPVVLAHSAPIDFIKDVLAIFFITKLDDYDDHRSLKKMLMVIPKPSGISKRLEWVAKQPEFVSCDQPEAERYQPEAERLIRDDNA